MALLICNLNYFGILFSNLLEELRDVFHTTLQVGNLNFHILNRLNKRLVC